MSYWQPVRLVFVVRNTTTAYFALNLIVFLV